MMNFHPGLFIFAAISAVISKPIKKRNFQKEEIEMMLTDESIDDKMLKEGINRASDHEETMKQLEDFEWEKELEQIFEFCGKLVENSQNVSGA